MKRNIMLIKSLNPVEDLSGGWYKNPMQQLEPKYVPPSTVTFDVAVFKRTTVTKCPKP